MFSQIIFILIVLIAFGAFGYTTVKIMKILTAAKGIDRFDKIAERVQITLLVAFGQSKILRKPIAGLLHAIVWWGFLVITIGTLEMIIDGIFGLERSLGFLGPIYSLITASGELFAVLIIVACFIFLVRRYIIKPKRFTAPEMKPSSRWDATAILIMIFFLMVSLLGMNAGYIHMHHASIHFAGLYPVGAVIADWIAVDSGNSLNLNPPEFYEMVMDISWWVHIVLVLLFLNILPYSKHFHVIMAVPNVFFSRLEPKAKLGNMESITKEVKLMMDPNADPYAAPPPEEAGAVPEKFGIKDVDNVTWKHILDSYTCTECGRCTEVCPANNTGKMLSPRKLFIDLRKRTTEAGPDFIGGLLAEQNGGQSAGSLVPELISEEELWACTTCMACIQECPVDIDHVPFIVDMRRNLVLEESKVPGDLASMFGNIENNGAPWAFSPEDRMNWAEEMEVPVMADMVAQGKEPEVLFWVGCSGSFDDRSQKITRAFCKILNECGIDYAVLGKEESCTGDPAKRAGNELTYQMQAFQNIELLNMYNVKKIVTACPHCYNILENEYSELGGNYEVMHHATFLKQLQDEGKLQASTNDELKGKKVVYHDSCYLGRGNDIYEAPRDLISSLEVEVTEMKRNRSKGMCCGAGGAQMFKEEEAGNARVNMERTDQALETGAEVIGTACPFCMTMMTDGVKANDKQGAVKVYDIAEILAG